jgi:hypothetical protein
MCAVALAFLAGLPRSADAYPWRMRYFGYGGGYSGGYGGWYPHYSARRFRAVPHGRHQVPEPKQDTGFGDLPTGPLQLVVNISTQKVTLYSDGVRVAQGPVSTGVPGHPTPLGVFSIIEKDRYHHSNIYSGAPMPYMQRITWSGVALHEGVLPGYPASHGCIRTSHDFARKLWPITTLGVRFIVSRAEVTPIDIEHPKLFVRKQKPPEPPLATSEAMSARGAQLALNAGEPGRGLQSGTSVASNATKVAEGLPELAPDELRRSVQVTISDESSPTGHAQPSAAQEEQALPPGEFPKPPENVDPRKPPAPARARSADQPVKRTGQVAVFISRKEKKIFVRQGMVPVFEMPVAIGQPEKPLGTHVFTALAMSEDGDGMRWNLMTIPTDGSMRVEYRGRRRGQEMPQPAVYAGPPSSAAEALDRIEVPREAVDRIGELLVPGSSLVISDEGLGRETGRGTEFIVLTR